MGEGIHNGGQCGWAGEGEGDKDLGSDGVVLRTEPMVTDPVERIVRCCLVLCAVLS